MGLITGALQIGRSALMAYQSALQVVGNNVSNAGSPNYTRQTPVLNPVTGMPLPEGFVAGGGVALTALQRNLDESLENRLRIALGEQSGAQVERQMLARVEQILNELSDHDLSSLMQEFFNAFSALENQPHDLGTRSIVLTAGESLAMELQRQRREVLALRNELNKALEDATVQADKLARDIADLNVRIVEVESASPAGANALRDQRDALLRQLSELVQIQVREQPGGSVNVYIGNELLIQGGMSRGLTTTFETTNEQPRTVVRFADNGGTVSLLGGSMAGMAAARDLHIQGHVDALNSLAAVIISEVNKVHAEGHGLHGFTEATGSVTVDDPTVRLNQIPGLVPPPRNGSFLIRVTDLESGSARTTTVVVNLDGTGSDDSLESLVARINAEVDGVTAEITPDGRFRIRADEGFEFSFAEDSSHALAALGVNTFFTGTDARNIAVNTVLVNDPLLLAAATENVPGDGSNAARIAALGTDPLPALSGQNLNEYYGRIALNVATKAAATMARAQSADAITLSLQAQRESISGVSLDEEAIALLRFERAFQGAARYTATVDRMIQEMLGLVR